MAKNPSPLNLKDVGDFPHLGANIEFHAGASFLGQPVPLIIQPGQGEEGPKPAATRVDYDGIDKLIAFLQSVKDSKPAEPPKDPRPEYLNVAGLHLALQREHDDAGFCVYETKEFPFTLAIVINDGDDHPHVRGWINHVRENVWESVVYINAPENFLRSLDREGVKQANFTTLEEALQKTQEAMGKFLLQAAKGLSFWSAFGQRQRGSVQVNLDDVIKVKV